MNDPYSLKKFQLYTMLDLENMEGTAFPIK